MNKEGKVLYHLKNYRLESILAPIFKMLEAAFELAIPLIVAYIVDVGIANNDIQKIVVLSIVMVVAAILGLVVSLVAQYYAAKAAIGTATSIRHSLFSHIQSLSYTEIDSIGVPTLIIRMTSDVNQVQNGINIFLRILLRSPFIVFGAFFMALFIDPQASLIFLATIAILLIIVFSVMGITQPLYKKGQELLDVTLTKTKENLEGSRVIRAFSNEEKEIKEYEIANEKLTKTQKKAGRISGLINPLTYVTINLAIVILVYFGAIKVNLGNLSQGQVIALYSYMGQILVEVIKLANLIVAMSRSKASAKRISDIFEIKSTSLGDNGLEADFNEKLNIEFKDVSLRYATAKEDSLMNISFNVKKGEKVGIIGGTGSGKTSLVNLISRFYLAKSGEILLNGININQYSTSSLNKQIAVVPQKAQLFKGTIRSNILFGNNNASEQDIINALKASQASFVFEKEKGLNSRVEQKGSNLSGGQKQRISIARALVKKSNILILDDSTSALDYVTDANLRKNLANLENSPTIFIVSQRVASIMHCDKIIVLDDGKMVGCANHDELLKSCQVYQEIYYSQFPKEDN